MNDLINSCFEAGLVLVVGLNIWKLIRDKEVKGVHWGTTAFVSLWGMWSVYYYLTLEQWFSMAAGVGACLANMTWLGLMLYYIRKPGGRQIMPETWDPYRSPEQKYV